MTEAPLVRIVDDEISTRTTLEEMLAAEGWRTASYPGAEEFLAADAPSVPGCIILDVRMGGMSGLELQAELNRRGSELPIIFYSAHGDIEMAVDTMKSGAKDFLPKTVGSEKLLAAVSKAVAESLAQTPLECPPSEFIARWESLSDRERETAELIAEGCLNRDISRKMQIALRTIYVYRVNIYRKLHVKTGADIALFVGRVRGILEGEARQAGNEGGAR